MFLKKMVFMAIAFGIHLSQAQQTLYSAQGYWNSSGGKDPKSAGNPSYTFSVTSAGNLKIELNSAVNVDWQGLVDTYLYLLNQDSTVNTYNDDFGGATQSQINVNLPVGTYRIVASTYLTGEHGDFFVNLTIPNSGGAAISIPSPQIKIQPANITVNANRCAIFKVYASLGCNFKWQKNDTDIVGATANTYSILSSSAGDAGTYRCLVSTPSSNLTSAAATLTVSGVAVAAANSWKQKQFYIGAWWDPRITGISSTDLPIFSKYRATGINLDLGVAPDVNASSTVNGWYTFNGGSVSNTYRIQRAQEVGMSYIAQDVRVTGTELPNNKTNITGTVSDYTNNLNTSQKNLLQGFFFGDEPWHNAVGASLFLRPLGEKLQTLEAMAITYPEKMGIINQLPFVKSAFPTWADYSNMVRGYLQNAFTKVISFDHYLFMPSTGTNPVVYQSYGNSYPYYFAEMALFGGQAAAMGKSFWAFGMSVDHEVYMLPTAAQLRYYASAGITYGAKGLIWFTYERPLNSNYRHAPNDNDATGSKLYADLASVNNPLLVLGPTLMDLKWLVTVHGIDIDPDTKEEMLPTTSSAGSAANGLVLYHSLPKKCAIGVLKNVVSDEKYLVIFNKSLNNSQMIFPKVYGNLFPILMDKSGSTSTSLRRSYHATTDQTTIYIGANSSDPTVLPGDFLLIRLAKDMTAPLAIPLLL